MQINKRTLKVFEPDLVNFCSNDYLGLSRHPLTKQKAIEYTEHYGVGSGSSRLVAGNAVWHEAFEKRLADYMGYEAALLMNTGYQANLSVLPTLLDRHSLILMDRYCHRSLIEAARLSRAHFKRFLHNDLRHLSALLQSAKQKNIAIVTESVFSMEGDCAPIDALVELSREFGAYLYVDESHGVGVMGPQGVGLAGRRQGVRVVVGSFGKAFGCFGSYVLCSQAMKEHFVQRCAGLIYSTALPPAVVGALEGALELLPTLDESRQKLKGLACVLRCGLAERGYDTGLSNTHIVPLILGEGQKAHQMEQRLFQAKIAARAICPPTVPVGQSRIRLSLTARLSEAHVERLIGCLGPL